MCEGGGGGGGGARVGTSGCFRCELWIEIESVVRSSRSRFEGRVELSTEEFLQGRGNVTQLRVKDRIIK